MRLPLPEGYVRVERKAVRGVVLADCAAALESIIAEKPLFDWARQHTERREYMGRGPVFGVPLPVCGVRVVVRRVRHGGLVGPLLGDVFLAPTRAPRELAMSLFLRQVGVATPPVVGFVTYPAGPLLRRADVMTAEVPDAEDLGAFLARERDAELREQGWRATATLLRRLTQSGVWHPDLNAKNVLLLDSSSTVQQPEIALVALLLDIDRVRLMVPGDPQVAEANLQRLLRSLRKRAQDPQNGPAPAESELSGFARLVRQDARQIAAATPDAARS